MLNGETEPTPLRHHHFQQVTDGRRIDFSERGNLVGSRASSHDMISGSSSKASCFAVPDETAQAGPLRRMRPIAAWSASRLPGETVCSREPEVPVLQ